MSDRRAALARAASADFAVRFGRPPRWVAAAPGRVNLIGEHTDYNDGFVLPMAIDRSTVAAAGPADGPDARVYAASLDAWASVALSPPVPKADGADGWANYVRGVVAGFLARGVAVLPFQAVIHSDVPLGSGLSSSAALEVSTATLLEAMTGTTLDPAEKALLCQRAEHEYAGVPCGIMDPFSSVFGRAGYLLLLDCRSQVIEPVALADPGVAALIVNSNVRHALTDGGYAARRKQCEEAARALGVRALRDVTPEQLEEARGRLDPVAYRRARHVITENARTTDTAAAVRAGDWDRVGRHMAASHTSLRDLFQVSCPELDVLVEAAAAVGPAGGVIGSRMTGGGFGGCTITLVRADRQDEVAQRITEQYRVRTGREATAFATPPADGARVIPIL
ncbi:MAG: galactokinase [Gemmataceae bacterium]|nr:galactokinase [Gemmataceae bacterium]